MASEPTVVDRAEQPYVAVSSNVGMEPDMTKWETDLVLRLSD